MKLYEKSEHRAKYIHWPVTRRQWYENDNAFRARAYRVYMDSEPTGDILFYHCIYTPHEKFFRGLDRWLSATKKG